jgi:CubicO group peptidase (beta-lactamase class C family)
MVSAAELIDDAVAREVIPGAVLAAGIGTAQPVLLHVAGDAQRDTAARRPMSADTIFDLASLTKVTATMPCVLHLVARGEVELDDPVRRFLPAFARAGDDSAGKDGVTVRQLLAHTSGLPDSRKYYEYLRDPAEIRAAALAEPLISTPGSVVRYSDVGFIVLGELCTSVAGCGLDRLVRDLVCEPLGMADTGYLPEPALASRIASTEHARGAAKTGVVHDENAEALGGVAGQAGLFGTAADLASYATAWACADSEQAAALRLPGWLRTEALACQTEGLAGNGLPGRRGLGWGLRGERWDNMGEGWPVTGAGHTGFTGTSLSVDPPSGMWVVLLTNAVHFGRGPDHSVVDLRKRVHASTAAMLLAGVVQ